MAKINIAINGIGRIGKNIFRRFFEKEYENLNLVAINLGESNIQSKLHLLKYDSIHGTFNDVDRIENDKIFVKGQSIDIIKERNIKNINWKNHNVDLILECTGNFNSKELSLRHIERGAKKVLVSAPCKDADNMVVLGVNHDKLSSEDRVVSIGSCTTNCLAPIAKILDENFGIKSGFMTTIHSYTNDQRIIDGGHKDLRRARAAAMSIIPTTTGAAKSIGLILPNLKGKLDGAAVRVPTPNVSMIDLSFISNKDISSIEINEIMRQNSKGNYRGIVEVAEDELVSIDFNHTTASAIFDVSETKVINKNFCRVVAWYDNEWAFSCRMLEIANLMAKS
ncbi:MAG: type I glyceraldehyde-3-phosphate dehydrogenase [Candidatus Midichloriaceae bacterium]